jgi:hypothetical protein
MFGSLVVVFPTPHEGGALLLRHCGQEWIFDSDQAFAAKGQPSIGYVAFFSDVENEVAQVISGHRITLTYNLYFDDGGPVSEPPRPVNEGAFHKAFTALLEDPEFLAEGGTLAFGLRHVYPIHPIGNYLKSIYDDLNGSDAAVYQSARVLGFEPVLYLYYQWIQFADSLGVITDKEIYFEEVVADEDQDLVDIAQKEGGILVAREGGGKAIELDSRFKSPELLEWVTPITTFNHQDGAYPTYGPGDEPELRWAYGYVCLVVRIGKAGDRLAYPTVAELNRADLREREEELDDYYYH